ncbi:phospho-N-acetylmuramoyl-pentapeptide-transferase [Sinanaerobacter chloroacetimidivorans]|uniref:Phospho-N-acetylmuramoyl-pentapeptide-transferase n=1 Tax=Sinanaerobacter chloroacetimidivorans TaxID=2818044 RepID=A0A8J8B0R9_9FIRM|nr:phospho-N-acetylmuramoyl-pentapeptide-transferase [Sinanaerobacter chloroacetimidivorans]MBR0597067.1 phospho-N-acetylmuramoyl-pentapeptide-transferase [Sinanaerobacter chloroacetimidivorans]
MEYLQIGITTAIAFIITVIGTPLTIPVLKRIKAGQSIREEGPKSHMVKSGTPTMGGIAIIGAVLITCFTAGKITTDLVIIIVAFVAFGALGFIDDFVKVSLKRNLGLTAKQKLLLQIIIAACLALYQSRVSVYGTSVFIPFVNMYLDFGIWYIPFISFVVVSMVNSVNLTDGLDGLASGVTLIVALFLALVGTTYGFTTTAIFCAAMAGACFGFLMFNKHPAKVFMGDTGSLALGGGIAAAAIMMNIELIIPIAGGVYVAEALSVVLQVASFKLRGKRIFKMAPLHHHFELSGWKETKVVGVFWMVTFVLCAISLLVV